MEALELSFTVGVPAEHAFETWTTRVSLWWPRAHTISRDPDASVTFEPRPGGRIYERAPDGREHDWGEVSEWEPPHRVVYLWHLMFDRTEATEVEVTFAPEGPDTRVTIRQRGWERLGAQAGLRRSRTRAGWEAVVRRYEEAVRN